MIVPADTGIIARWAHYYADNKAVSAAVVFVHLAGILLGGGIAVASDRTSLQLKPGSEPDMPRELARLGAVHRIVVGALAIIVTSGLLMLFSDLHTFITSALYWTKMGLVVALLLNGFIRLRAENRLAAGSNDWRTFRVTSGVSLVLWFSILLCGAFLSTIS